MNWNYISGFFDADGYITLLRPGKGRNKTLYVGFTNVEKDILLEIQSFVQNELGIKGFITTKKSKNENHSDSHELKYVYNNALKVIEMIETYHPKKQHRKKVVIEQYIRLTPRNGKYTEEMKIEREKMINTFFSL